MFTGPHLVTDGLVLCLDAADPLSYPGSGTTWRDLSGNENNGTLTNGPTFDSANGGIIDFDGQNDRVSLGYQSTMNNTDITQEAWVKADVFVNWHGIISNMPSWGTGFSLQIGTTQNIAAMVSGGYLRTSWTPQTNIWYHIVATHRSSDNLAVLYVNGIQENSLNRAVSYSPNAVTEIGVFYTGGSLPLNGKIASVKTYNKALTAQEVLQNYNATKTRFGL